MEATASRRISNAVTFKLILGPCAIESRTHALYMADIIRECTRDLKDVDIYYKSSFDKANRTSGNANRGVGIEEGADILQEIRETKHFKTLTDVHETQQCERLEHSVDVLQIPAFLCRQTDLLMAAEATGRIVNVKKGQFLAPWDMKNVAAKFKPETEVWLTERGTSFGYNTLVVDYRGLPIMRETGRPVIFDATHSVQQPGGQGTSSGGQRQYVETLARAAIAVGIDGLFMETHDDPDRAISDGPNQIPTKDLREMLKRLLNQ